jgi:hypothetical protein
MMRQLTMVALGGLLSSFLLAGNAEACGFKNKCNKCARAVACVPAPVACVQPAPCPRPVKVASCAPRPKKCGLGLGGLFAGLCHKKSCAPAPAPCATVAYTATYSYTYATPQASGQYPVGTPQVPGKSMGTPQR